MSHRLAVMSLPFVTFLLLLVTLLPPPAAAQTQPFADSVVRAQDAAGLPFAVLDKSTATLSVFDARGRLLGQTPALLGEAVGDVAPADIGTRPLRQIPRNEKITSAGRYVTEPGVNAAGEDIVWLDYDAALSMHRVRHVPGERRPQRLASASTADNRISFGCINLPPEFYEQHIAPLFRDQAGVVYVLPETYPASRVFPFIDSTASNSSP